MFAKHPIIHVRQAFSGNNDEADPAEATGYCLTRMHTRATSRDPLVNSNGEAHASRGRSQENPAPLREPAKAVSGFFSRIRFIVVPEEG